MSDLVIVSKSEIEALLSELEEKYHKQWREDLSSHSEGMGDGIANARVELSALIDKATPCGEAVAVPKFPVMLRKMWSGGEVQEWINENYTTPQVPVSSKAFRDAKLYQELIYNVSNKYPNETRHETALRYIRKAENQPDQAMLTEAMKGQ